LTLRPAKPPRSLAILNIADVALPVVPYAEAGPLYGIVLPRRISLAVTPGDSSARTIAGAAGMNPPPRRR
jgi:hypothetical protein